jgi:hypothetical protein
VSANDFFLFFFMYFLSFFLVPASLFLCIEGAA